MDQLLSFQSVAKAYYSIIEVIALCLLLLYEFVIYVSSATPFSQKFPLQAFFITMLIIILVGLALLNIHTVLTRNMLLGVTLVSIYLPEKNYIQRKSILLIVGTHASLLIINLFLLVFLPVNGTILLILGVIGILFIIFTKAVLGKKQLIKTTSTTTCVHCHERLNELPYSAHQTGTVDHCRTCSNIEHRITHIATVDLLVRPIALLLTLYTALVIAQLSMIFTKAFAGPNSGSYIITEVMVLIALYAYILAVYFVYPLLTLRKLRSLKKNPNFGLVNIIQGSSKKNTTIIGIMYIEFMTTYMLMCIPVVGLVALMVMTGLALTTNIFPTISLKELLNRPLSNHNCHLGSTRTYLI